MNITPRGNPLPPRALRDRVHGSPDRAGFLAVGKRCAHDIAAALESIGRPLSTFRAALDFGCGSGRVLRYLHHPNRTAVDIDVAAVAWCQRNYPTVRCLTTNADPPLPFADATFDLIYAVSVFTHLNEDRQDMWLAELRRVLTPGGVIIASLHGPTAQAAHLEPERIAEIAATGFAYQPTERWAGVLPEWYGVAWHTEGYVRRRWGGWHAYLPAALNGSHDLVITGRGGSC